MSYTPKPWEILVAGPEDGDGTGIPVIYGDNNRQFVAFMYPINDNNAERVMANARLIAKAPELLAACKVALDCIDPDAFRKDAQEGDFPLREIETCKNLRAIIDKVEGRQK